MLISSPENQITLYFDPNSSRGKQTLVYAKTFNLPISEKDIYKEPFTGAQLVELARLLNISLSEIADTEKALYKEEIGDAKNFSKEDWITVLTQNPELVRSPIAMKGEKVMLINTPTDILQL